MKSLAKVTNKIELPMIEGEYPMIPFDVKTFEGLSGVFLQIAKNMLQGVDVKGGTAFLTLHGKKLKKGETLRRGGPHTDGNYEPHLMTFGGSGWKVGQDGPGINTALHDRQYNNPCGGIIIASNYSACLGWIGEYAGLPRTGGDCSHIQLDTPFELEPNKVYYGNNHFIHESVEVKDNVHRVFARITLPENHEYS